VFISFTQFLQAIAGTVPHIRPRPVPSTTFPVHYSVITAVAVRLRKASFGEPQEEKYSGKYLDLSGAEVRKQLMVLKITVFRMV
jgi:hypothetical protein